MPFATTIYRFWLPVILMAVPFSISADESDDVTVPMYAKGMATYYVRAQLADLASGEFMVDTGSGYLTINEHTLDALKARKQAQYVKSYGLSWRMAPNSLFRFIGSMNFA